MKDVVGMLLIATLTVVFGTNAVTEEEYLGVDLWFGN